MAEQDDERPIYVIPVPGIDEPGADAGTPATIQMYAPNDGQYAVLLRTAQQVSARGGDRTDVARNLGMMYRLLDLLIVEPEDKGWLDNLMVTGELSAEDGLGLVLDLLREHVKTVGDQKAPAAGPVRRVAAANRTRK